MKSPPDEACRTLASHLTDSPVEQLDLEFDLISIIRYSHFCLICMIPGKTWDEERDDIEPRPKLQSEGDFL